MNVSSELITLKMLTRFHLPGYLTINYITVWHLVVLGVLITTAFLFFIRDALLMAFGGVIFATPLAVIAMVLVGMFYVEDVLGKEIIIPGRDEEQPDQK